MSEFYDPTCSQIHIFLKCWNYGFTKVKNGKCKFICKLIFPKVSVQQLEFQKFSKFQVLCSDIIHLPSQVKLLKQSFHFIQVPFVRKFWNKFSWAWVFLQFFRVPNSYNSLVFSSLYLVIWHFSFFFLVIFSSWYFFSSSLTALMIFLTVFHSDHIKSSILICMLDVSFGKKINIYIFIYLDEQFTISCSWI